MSAAACLLAYSVLVLVAGPGALARFTAGGRFPRLGILAWQLSCGSVLGSWLLAGLAAASLTPVGALSWLLHACARMIGAAAAGPDSGALRLAGGLGAAAVAGLVVAHLAAGMWAERRRRARHLDALAVLGRRVRGLDAVVLDRAEPAVYCLSGRKAPVVITSGALDRLAPDQLRAALAHERAHLRGRHHLVLAGLLALAKAFPMLRLFADAPAQAGRLLEMAADDAAALRHGRDAVAGALLALAGAAAPAGVLAAGGAATAERVERLLLAGPAPARTAAAGLAALSAAFLAGPLVCGLGPLLVVALRYWGLCPLPV